MAVRVVPTLAAMAEVYRRPLDERFDAYVDLARTGAPVASYNPMTSQDVLGTIERLLAIDAEALVAESLADVETDLALAIVVAAPGMWTDRLATEVEHRLAGKGRNEVLLWVGEDTGADAVRAAALADFVRATRPVPRTVAEAVEQEGDALALAGMTGTYDDHAAEVLDVLGADTTLSSMVAFLYGDDAAAALGFTPVGLGPRVGERHAVALAHRYRQRA